MSLIDLEPRKPAPASSFAAATQPIAKRRILSVGADSLALSPRASASPSSLNALFRRLPIAGSELSARPLLATLPYALTLVGALAASLPAAMLSDVFGRKSAFALGASSELAGAALAAWGLSRQFSGLASAASGSASPRGLASFIATPRLARPAKVAIVLGPVRSRLSPHQPLLSLAQNLSGPLAPAVALLLVLACRSLSWRCASLCRGKRIAAKPVVQTVSADATYVWASIAGALAWFGMALIMAGSPSLMAHCGIGMAGRAEVISWHSLAMYAPAAILGASGWRPPRR